MADSRPVRVKLSETGQALEHKFSDYLIHAGDPTVGRESTKAPIGYRLPSAAGSNIHVSQRRLYAGVLTVALAGRTASGISTHLPRVRGSFAMSRRFSGVFPTRLDQNTRARSVGAPIAKPRQSRNLADWRSKCEDRTACECLACVFAARAAFRPATHRRLDPCNTKWQLELGKFVQIRTVALPNVNVLPIGDVNNCCGKKSSHPKQVLGSGSGCKHAIQEPRKFLPSRPLRPLIPLSQLLRCDF
jgi:hypothetical protein